MCKREPLLNEEEIGLLRSDLQFFLKAQGLDCSDHIASGQQIALGLLQGLLHLWSDLDVALPEQLDRGVSTGVLETIPASGVWREVDVAERPPQELLVWDRPWQSGLDDAELLLQLVQADDGGAEWLPGGYWQRPESALARIARQANLAS